MNIKTVNASAMAVMVAGLFAAAAVSAAPLGSPAGDQAMVKCVNSSSCKGHGACKQATNSCKGQNSCKVRALPCRRAMPIAVPLRLLRRSDAPGRGRQHHRPRLFLRHQGQAMAITSTTCSGSLPYLGYGLGLRVEHYEALLANPGAVQWLEVVSENYMVSGGLPLVWLDRFRERFPLVMHGVSLSIGSTDPLDEDYLARLAALAQRIERRGYPTTFAGLAYKASICTI